MDFVKTPNNLVLATAYFVTSRNVRFLGTYRFVGSYPKQPRKHVMCLGVGKVARGPPVSLYVVPGLFLYRYLYHGTGWFSRNTSENGL